MNVPSPASFGWQSDPETDVWMTHWTDQPLVRKALEELTRCSFKTDCSSNRNVHVRMPSVNAQLAVAAHVVYDL
ncbi:hypothetical protein DPMN_013607 [Dreissena polymorpha]|uniref:Uncharacterized protein n=1 Tax=Dreissena polymorpha TaxID=45954 RepID=A0A9D4N4J1_DREPO|nr:hypothetical protein DPMN_013607 [Dreissena polymorpha]